MVPPVHRLIVGLTNPGRGGAPHDLGGDFVKRLAQEKGIALNYNDHVKALIGEGIVDGKKIHLLVPQTGMNSSGKCVKAYMRHYNFVPNKIVVVADEMGRKAGWSNIEVTCGQTHHNGVLSIIREIESSEFSRVQVGVGKMPGPRLLQLLDPKIKEKLPEDSIIEAMKALLISDAADVAGQFKQLNQG